MFLVVLFDFFFLAAILSLFLYLSASNCENDDHYKKNWQKKKELRIFAMKTQTKKEMKMKYNRWFHRTIVNLYISFYRDFIECNNNDNNIWIGL